MHRASSSSENAFIMMSLRATKTFERRKEKLKFYSFFSQELFGCKFFEKRLHGNETCTVVGSQDKAKKFKVKWFALKLESITWYTIETTLE